MQINNKYIDESDESVDIVITWVDGDDPKHLRKRKKCMKNNSDLHTNAVEVNRWRNKNELIFCLLSIQNHASWVRKIWIITDSQTPNLHSLKSETLKKIRLVDHKHIFDGYHNYLPTFNSVSIETFMWRIPELSERFIYLNDDVFITSPVQPSDFYKNKYPLLRGNWVDFTTIEENQLHRFHKRNAAELLGYNVQNMFSSAHVGHPMLKSVLEELFRMYTDTFSNNASYKFRSECQFLPVDAHNHFLLSKNLVDIVENSDYINLSLKKLESKGVVWVEKKAKLGKKGRYKMMCLNDFFALNRSCKKIKKYILHAIGCKH